MDGSCSPSDREAHNGTQPRTAEIKVCKETGIPDLRDGLGSTDLSLVCLFVSPLADFDHIARDASQAFAGATVVACTTAGEIGSGGYADGHVVAAAFPRQSFASTTLELAPLSNLDPQSQIERVIKARRQLAREAAHLENEFAFLLIDGLSMREDELTAMLASGLGSVPLFGGSAGDGNRYCATFLAHGEKVMQDAALLTIIRTSCPVRVFSLDHLIPTDQRMVVTKAAPQGRIVMEINAEPAAEEYARILGIDPDQLDQSTLAAHPIVVRVGERHHVRSIQRATDKNELVFLAAIDEGAVLSLARQTEMDRHLEREFTRLRQPHAPSLILACDCILRRVEADQRRISPRISGILADNRVIGFSTYGEQFRSMHVNQTMTGVAIYPPLDGVP